MRIFAVVDVLIAAVPPVAHAIRTIKLHPTVCSMTGPAAALHRRQCDMLLKHLDHMRGDMVLLDTHMQVAPVECHMLQAWAVLLMTCRVLCVPALYTCERLFVAAGPCGDGRAAVVLPPDGCLAAAPGLPQLSTGGRHPAAAASICANGVPHPSGETRILVAADDSGNIPHPHQCSVVASQRGCPSA